MSLRWPVQVTLVPDLAREYIQSQGWDLKINSIIYFGQGWDNIAFLVNNNLIFRFAKTDQTAALLVQENIVLPHLQNLSLQVPNPIYIGSPNNINPYHFHGYKKLQGTPAYQVDLSNDDLKVCLQQLAYFLKGLHSFSAHTAQGLGAKPIIFDRTKVELVSDGLLQRLQKLYEARVMNLDQDFIKKMIQQAQKVSLIDQKDCLVHGDLDMRHLLVIDNKLSGIIDWGDVGIGHPVADIAAVFCWFPQNIHHIFFEIYGAVTQDVQKYARFIALHRAITLLWYGYEIDDQKMISAAMKAYYSLQLNSL